MLVFFRVLEVICVTSVDVVNIALPIVDAGIQVWNGIAINKTDFVKTQEWSGDITPAYEYPVDPATGKIKLENPCETKNCTEETFDTNQTDIKVSSDLNGDFLNVKKEIFSFTISENFKFEVTYETILSIAIVQFPAVCLACFGIFVAFRKHGLSSSAVKDALHASLIIFLPFCFVELFAFESNLFGQIVMEKVKIAIDYMCGACSDRCVQWFDLLHFLRKNEKNNQKDKMLSVEVTKLLFGTCLQFCFQMILYLGYTKQEDVEYSQMFSIISSFFIICKLGVDIVRFKRKISAEDREIPHEQVENVETQFLEKVKTYFNEKYKKMSLKKIFIRLFLLLTSVASNVGTLIMSILVWNEYALIYISVVFGLNLFVSLLLPFDFMERCERKMRLEFKLDTETNTLVDQKKVMDPWGLRVFRGIFVSWSNIFFLSRPVEDSSYFRTKHMVMMQIVRFPLNLATLFVLISYTLGFSLFAESLKMKLLYWTLGLIAMGILNMTMVILYSYQLNCCIKAGNDTVKENDDAEQTQLMPIAKRRI